jgi:hypothetical protein
MQAIAFSYCLVHAKLTGTVFVYELSVMNTYGSFIRKSGKTESRNKGISLLTTIFILAKK